MKRAILTAYQLLSTLLLPFIVAGLLLRARSQKAYGQRLGQRLGFCPKPHNCETKPHDAHVKFKPNRQGSIVIHGASLGEITALKAFILQTLEQYPNHCVTVTSFTPAGSQQVKALFGERVNHSYLPIDSPLCNALFLARLKPSVMVFMETELWPSLIQQAHKRGVKLLLINARLSQKSVGRYQKISGLIGPTLQRMHHIQAQSDDNRQRFLQLGADATRTLATGNVKYDLHASKSTNTLVNTLKDAVQKRSVWVVGSSHQDEETLILDAFDEVRRQHPNTLLILAPRHLERHAPLHAQLQLRGLNPVLRSQHQNPTPANAVWLIDTLGELLAFYGIASVCTVAGSFGQTGGHNPLEPALFGKATILGPNMQNAAELTQQMCAANAVMQLGADELQRSKTSSNENNRSENNSNKTSASKTNTCNAQTLASAVNTLLNQPEQAASLGHNAQQLLQKNQGATAKALQALAECLRA